MSNDANNQVSAELPKRKLSAAWEQGLSHLNAASSIGLMSAAFLNLHQNGPMTLTVLCGSWSAFCAVMSDLALDRSRKAAIEEEEARRAAMRQNDHIPWPRVR